MDAFWLQADLLNVYFEKLGYWNLEKCPYKRKNKIFLGLQSPTEGDDITCLSVIMLTCVKIWKE